MPPAFTSRLVDQDLAVDGRCRQGRKQERMPRWPRHHSGQASSRSVGARAAAADALTGMPARRRWDAAGDAPDLRSAAVVAEQDVVAVAGLCAVGRRQSVTSVTDDRVSEHQASSAVRSMPVGRVPGNDVLLDHARRRRNADAVWPFATVLLRTRPSRRDGDADPICDDPHVLDAPRAPRDCRCRNLGIR